MWLEFLSWAAKELSPCEHSLIHLINDIIHKDLCFCKGTLLQILLLWDGHDWKNGVNRTEINKRRINVRALGTLRNYDGNRRVEKAISKTTILQELFPQIFFFFFLTSLNNYSAKWPNWLQVLLRSCGKAIQVIRDQSLLITGERGEESEDLGLNMVKHRRSPLSYYNMARVLALYKSYWAAMNKIFIYARPCVNKMTWTFFTPGCRVAVLLSCSTVFVLFKLWKKSAKNCPIFLSALTF